MVLRQLPEQYFYQSENEQKPAYIHQYAQFAPYQTAGEPNYSTQILVVGIIAALALGISLALLLRR